MDNGRVTFDEIVQHYGGVAKAKTALGLKSRQTLYNWREDGVPSGQQCRIQILTRGKLRADDGAKSAKKAA